MHGNDAARDYWVRQWSRVHTHDEPSEPIELDDGRIAVHIDQRIRMPDGSPVSTARFIHAHHTTSPPWPLPDSRAVSAGGLTWGRSRPRRWPALIIYCLLGVCALPVTDPSAAEEWPRARDVPEYMALCSGPCRQPQSN